MIFRGSNGTLVNTERISVIEKYSKWGGEYPNQQEIPGVLVTFEAGGTKFLPAPEGSELYEVMLENV